MSRVKRIEGVNKLRSFGVNRLNCALAAMTALALCAAESEVRAANVVFRDDFSTATLDTGWTFVRGDEITRSLTSRPGYFRIQTQRGSIITGNSKNIMLRKMSGNFILETRLEFNPTTAQQFAGLVVYQDDTHGVVLGLVYAKGERGEFRGAVVVSAKGPDVEGERSGAFYDDSVSANPNLIYLRLLRSGNQFVTAYSADGVTYSELSIVTNDLPDPIDVGITAGNGDFDGCGSECDTPINADFDFFQISSLGTTTNPMPGDDPILDTLVIDGPTQLVVGQPAAFKAVATLTDGSTQDVTTKASWLAAPPDRATVDKGAVFAADLEELRPVTLVATYTQLIGDALVTRTATRVVPIRASGSAPAPNPFCGLGFSSFAPAIGLGCMLMRRTWRRRTPRGPV